MHLSSVLSLAVFVFLGGVVVKFTDRVGTNENGLKRTLPLLSFGLGVNHASADVPGDPGGFGSGSGGLGDGDCDAGGGGDSAGDGDC